MPTLSPRVSTDTNHIKFYLNCTGARERTNPILPGLWLPGASLLPCAQGVNLTQVREQAWWMVAPHLPPGAGQTNRELHCWRLLVGLASRAARMHACAGVPSSIYSAQNPEDFSRGLVCTRKLAGNSQHILDGP